MHLDITLTPKPHAQGMAVASASTARVYESSLPGLVSFFLRNPTGGVAGLRIDREQTVALRDALTAYLERTEG